MASEATFATTRLRGTRSPALSSPAASRQRAGAPRFPEELIFLQAVQGRAGKKEKQAVIEPGQRHAVERRLGPREMQVLARPRACVGTPPPQLLCPREGSGRDHED